MPDAHSFQLREPHSFQLRAYEPPDFARLVEIDQSCFIEGIAYPAEEMRYFLGLPSAITLVGTQKGKIQGFVIADRLRVRRGARGMGRIITIDVAPGAQNSGLGTLLLTRAEEALKESGCDYVSLEVAVNNHQALGFYKKMGYAVLKRLPGYYLGSIDGLMMGKKL